MRIDWGNKEQGWRVWPNGFDDPTDFTYQPDLPARRVTFHRDETRGWLEVDMAEMTEIDSLKVALADKQMLLDDAMRVQGQMFGLLRAFKDGTITIDRVNLTPTGYEIVPAVEAQAEQIASEADRG